MRFLASLVCLSALGALAVAQTTYRPGYYDKNGKWVPGKYVKKSTPGYGDLYKPWTPKTPEQMTRDFQRENQKLYKAPSYDYLYKKKTVDQLFKEWEREGQKKYGTPSYDSIYRSQRKTPDQLYREWQRDSQKPYKMPSYDSLYKQSKPKTPDELYREWQRDSQKLYKTPSYDSRYKSTQFKSDDVVYRPGMVREYRYYPPHVNSAGKYVQGAWRWVWVKQRR